MERISADDARLRAFNFVDLSATSANADPESKLHGMPVAVKDLIDVQGMPTTASSDVLKDNVANRDAPVVARLRAAGATIVGKTNLDEFAYGVFSPPTRNPWDEERIAGGSSGGSAAAVAAGMCIGALGTDTGGSVRIPAALCGVFGLKPRQVVDMTGVIPLAPSLDRCGPLARDVRTLADLWAAMTEPRSSPERERFAVAVLDLAGLDIEPSLARRYADLVAALRADDSCDVVVKPCPPPGRWQRSGGIVLAWEAWTVHEERGWFPTRAELYTPRVRQLLESASRYSASKVEEARSDMDGLRRAFGDLMDGVDVALMPTTPCTAPRGDEITDETRSHWVNKLTLFAGDLNFCDLAAVTIPLWAPDSRLPWGVDAIAADEWTAIDFAAAHAPGKVRER